MKHLLTTLSLLMIVLQCNPRESQATPDDIVLQSTSSDCGPAALATLLKVYFDIPTTEAEMVKLTGAKPQFGTTLLQLEEAAIAKGCQAGSYRMDWNTLKQQVTTYTLPIIVRTMNPEAHFSLLLGIKNDAVYIADPASGHIMLDERAFLKRWLVPGFKTGFAFVAISPNGEMNEARRVKILSRLIHQHQNLRTMQITPPVFRR